jgi:hypothetical protein
MRDDEAAWPRFVPRHDIGGAVQGKLDEVAPSDGRADGREGVRDA